MTRPQTLGLCAVLGAMTLVMAWAGFSFYRATLPPVYLMVRDGSIVGRTLASVRFWHGEPDATPRVKGWDATYSFVEFSELDGVAALKVDHAGRVVECRNFQNETYARSCFPESARRTLLSP